MKTILEIAEKEGCLHGPVTPHLKGADVMTLGLTPGKELGSILKQAYKKQLESLETSHQELKNWAAKNLRKLVIDAGGPTPFITGEDLKNAMLTPSKEFSDILNKSYKKQLSGEIKTKEESQRWLSGYLQNKHQQINLLAL
jgi:hypothetical protein